MEIGSKRQMIEIHAVPPGSVGGGDYEIYFVGAAEEGMSSIDRDGWNMNSQWGWGLLENWEGNTTQHFRPASYG